MVIRIREYTYHSDTQKTEGSRCFSSLENDNAHAAV